MPQQLAWYSSASGFPHYGNEAGYDGRFISPSGLSETPTEQPLTINNQLLFGGPVEPLSYSSSVTFDVQFDPDLSETTLPPSISWIVSPPDGVQAFQIQVWPSGIPSYGTATIVAFANGIRLPGSLVVELVKDPNYPFGLARWYTRPPEPDELDSNLLSRIRLDSALYEISVNGSTELTLDSFIYTPYGEFRITPIKEEINLPETIKSFIVVFNNRIIGEVFTNQFGLDPLDLENVAAAMAAAIDIVTNKVEEFLEQEERAILANLVAELKDSVDMSPEQKAIYRTYIKESGMLPEILAEIENPTDILGIYNASN